MTEAGWLAGAVPDELLEPYEIWEEAGERKCRLYAVACARRIWHLFPDDLSRQVVERLELLADGFCEESAFEAACRAFLDGSAHEGLSGAQAMARSVVAGFPFDSEGRLATMAESYSLAAARGSATSPTSPAEQSREWETTRDLMRELLLHLFRPAEMPPLRLTPTVIALALAAYEERHLPSGHLAPARLSVLADALEDAGRTEQVVLDHLRSPGPHVRGCWPVDLILAKE